MALLGERYSDTNYSKPLLGCTARSSWQMRWQSMTLAVWLACSKKEYGEYPTFTSAQSTKRKSLLQRVPLLHWSDTAVGNRRDLPSSGGDVMRCHRGNRAGYPPRKMEAVPIAEGELMYMCFQWTEMSSRTIPMHLLRLLLNQKVFWWWMIRSLLDIFQEVTLNTFRVWNWKKNTPFIHECPMKRPLTKYLHID